MTPYLSVIKDSFREAMASRVLWLVLVLITLLLLAVLPFHWVGTVGARMDGNDIRSIRNMAADLQLGEKPDATELQKRIWESVGESTRRELNAVNEGKPGPHRFVARKLLADDFNKLIERDEFFDPQLWEGIELSARLKELNDSPNRTPELTQQRNRLALEAALPGMLRKCPEESMLFRYAKWDLSFLPAMTRTRAVEQIDFVIMIALPLFVGFFGIFAAVLVTAPIIPNMLASGSLTLLLSKPIARPLLFLSKFLGGCSFVFINVCYLVLGVLLFLGLRFQIWKPQLLWAIPIFLFSFAIFYSVSAVSGLIWRSTVLAIAMTVLFWVACVSVGATRGTMLLFLISPDRIQQIVVDSGELFVQRSNGNMGRWNDSTGVLDEIMKVSGAQAPAMMGGPKYQGVVFDAKAEMLLALQRTWSESNIYASLRANHWSRELPTKGPKNPLAIFLRNGQPTVVAEDGVYAVSMAQAEEPLADINIFGLKIPAPAPKDSHERISEELERMSSRTKVAYSARDDRIYLQSGRELRYMALSDGLLRVAANVESDLDDVSAMAAGEGIVVIANREEASNSLHLFRGAELEDVTKVHPEGDDEIRSLSVSSGGDWLAMLTDDDLIQVYDTQTTQVVWSAKGICAAQFVGDELWTANLHDAIVSRSFPNAVMVKQFSPKLPWPKRIYSYVVNPLYLTFPKPSELENTMRYALTGKDTQKVEGPGMGPNGRTVKLDPWQPLYSNSAFIGLMLLFGCWYIHRQDF